MEGGREEERVREGEKEKLRRSKKIRKRKTEGKNVQKDENTGDKKEKRIYTENDIERERKREQAGQKRAKVGPLKTKIESSFTQRWRE